MIERSLSNQMISDLEQLKLENVEEWVIEEDEQGIVIVIANSKAALQRFRADQAAPGDFVMNIGFIPVSFFERGEFADLNIKLSSSPDAFLQSIMPMLRLTRDKAEGAVVSESEPVSLSDKSEAGLLKISDEERDGTIIVFEAAEGVIAFVSAEGHPSEMDNYRKVLLTIAANIEYRGSAEDLMTAFYRT